MSAREIADRVGPEVAAPRPYEAHLERVDQAIAEAERQVEEQERRIAQVAQGGRDAAHEIFELQKMQLLVAILREGRERLVERLSRLN
jgi:multidrug resistance efflux pump